MKVLVIGANGNTATRLLKKLKDGPHDPVAMIRNPAQREKMDAIGVPTVVADLEYPIDHAVAGCDAVIFAAGSGGKTGKDKTVLVDHLGAIRSMVAAQTNGAKRYIMLSALNVDVNSEAGIAHYYKAKAHADNFLRESELDFTVVCPGGLSDDEGTGSVEIFPTVGSGRTSRDNLAWTLAACLDAESTIGKTFGLLDGDTPIADALATV